MLNLRWSILVAIGSLVSGSTQARAGDLPEALQSVRAEIVRICQENTLRDDNIPEVRQELEPLIEQLADWFNANRPADEVGLTQQPWKSIWYDDPTIDGFSNLDLGFLTISLRRDAVYQVVEDGYYYNVSEAVLRLGGLPLRIRTFLKGAYTLADPAGPGTIGLPKRNVVDLEFVANSIRLGRLWPWVDLRRLVDRVETGRFRTTPVPGPIGITGELWNLYIDDELRISAGSEDSLPDVIDLYILLRSDRTGPIR